MLKRFSLRSLLVLLTLVCAYCACWGPTKNTGVKSLVDRPSVWQAEAVAPLVIKVDEDGFRRYYVWMFGAAARLPYERQLEQLPGPWDWQDDVQYFAPGSAEWLRVAAEMKAYQTDQAAQSP